jgi:hypothetical protein
MTGCAALLPDVVAELAGLLVQRCETTRRNHGGNDQGGQQARAHTVIIKVSALQVNL